MQVEYHTQVLVDDSSIAVNVHCPQTEEHWQYQSDTPGVESRDALFAWVEELAKGNPGIFHAICSVINEACKGYLQGRRGEAYYGN